MSVPMLQRKYRHAVLWKLKNCILQQLVLHIEAEPFSSKKMMIVCSLGAEYLFYSLAG